MQGRELAQVGAWRWEMKRDLDSESQHEVPHYHSRKKR